MQSGLRQSFGHHTPDTRENRSASKPNSKPKPVIRFYDLGALLDGK